jgi:hypothetical protein
MPRTAPTRIAVIHPTVGPWSNAAGSTRTTASFNVLAGDVLVVVGGTEDAGATLAAPTGGSLTWAQQENVGTASSSGRAAGWTATVDVDKSMTVSITATLGVFNFWGFAVLQFRGSQGIGAHANQNNAASGVAPSLALTSLRDNSSVVYINVDWTAADGSTTRAYRAVNGFTPTAANGGEIDYYRDPGGTNYGLYLAVYPDVGVAGSDTFGLTAPVQRPTIIAIEVFGSGPVPLTLRPTAIGAIATLPKPSQSRQVDNVTALASGSLTDAVTWSTTAANNWGRIFAGTAQGTVSTDALATTGLTFTANSATTGANFWRTTKPLNGSFDATAWTFNFVYQQSVTGNTARFRVRVWRGRNEDGSSATELTAAVQDGSTANPAAATNTTSSITWSPGAISLDNEYLFFEIGAQRTAGAVASSMTLRTETNIVTPNFAPDAAAKTIYPLATTAVTPNFWGNMQDGGTAPTAANAAFGWVVAKTAVTTPFWRARLGASATASVAAATSQIDSTTGPQKGTGAANTTAGDSFVAGPYTGTFDSATPWVLQWVMATGVVAPTGRLRCQVWRSANADGSAATELTTSTLVSAVVAPAATGLDCYCNMVWSPGAVTLANEYLFFQVEWEETVAGSTTTTNVLFKAGPNAAVFTPALSSQTDFTITITAATVAIVGQQVVESYGQVIAPDFVAITVAGQALFPAYGVNGALTPGSVPIAGSNVQPSTAQTEAINPGAVPIAGGTLIATHNIPEVVSSNSVPIAGGNVSAAFGRLDALAPGTVSIAGAAVNPVFAVLEALTAGAVPIAGAAVTVTYGQLANLAAGVVPIAGVNVAAFFTGHVDYAITITAGIVPIVGGNISSVLAFSDALSAGSVPIIGGPFADVLAFSDALTVSAVPIAGGTIQALLALAETLSPSAVPIAAANLFVAHGFVDTLSPGTLPISGNPVNPLIAFVDTLSPGLVAIVGGTINPQTTGSYAITITAGSVPINGATVTPSVGTRETLTASAVPVVGSAVADVFGRLDALTPNAVTINGVNVTPKVGTGEPFTPGTVPIAGGTINPSAAGSYTLTITAGAVSIAGQALQDILARTDNIVAGIVPITGQLVSPFQTVFYGLSLAPGIVPIAGASLQGSIGRTDILSPGVVPLVGGDLFALIGFLDTLTPGIVPIIGQDLSVSLTRRVGIESFDLTPGASRYVQVVGQKRLELMGTARGPVIIGGQR